MATPTNHQLRLAGWISFFLAITYPLLFLLSIVAGFTENRDLAFLNVLISILTAGGYCYIYLTLKEFFEHRVHTDSVTRYIHIFVVGTLLLTVLGVLSYMFLELEAFTSVLMLIILVVFGLTSMLFGLALLRIKQHFELKNMLGYLNIFGGVILTSIILFPIAVFIEFFIYIFLGILLLRASEA